MEDVKTIFNAHFDAQHPTHGMMTLRSDDPFDVPPLQLISSGRVLDREKTLGAYGIQENHIIHVEYDTQALRKREKLRLHYEPESRTRYVSKEKRRADRARRAEMKGPKGVEKAEEGTEYSQAEPKYLCNVRKDLLPGLRDDGNDESDNEKEVDVDECEIEEDGRMANLTKEMLEAEKAGLQITDLDGESAQEVDEANFLAVEGMYEQDTETAQQTGSPDHAEEGELVEMQWEPDPFTTEDEDKENWDPQLGPQLFSLPITAPEDSLPSEMWSMYAEQWMRGGVLSIGSSYSGS